MKLSELKSGQFSSKASTTGCVADSIMTQRDAPPTTTPTITAAVTPPQGEEEGGEQEGQVLRRRSKKAGAAAAGGGGGGGGAATNGESRVKSRRQRDFDPTAVDEEEEKVEEKQHKQEKREETQQEPEEQKECVWTQNQQKLLETALQQIPRGAAERWDRIAKMVPGKTKVSGPRLHGNRPPNDRCRGSGFGQNEHVMDALIL